MPEQPEGVFDPRLPPDFRPALMPGEVQNDVAERGKGAYSESRPSLRLGGILFNSLTHSHGGRLFVIVHQPERVEQLVAVDLVQI